MHYATFNHVWASLLLEELYRWGLREVVVAPGSRSTPLTRVGQTAKQWHTLHVFLEVLKKTTL